MEEDNKKHIMTLRKSIARNETIVNNCIKANREYKKIIRELGGTIDCDCIGLSHSSDCPEWEMCL